ncbi:MAG TPA: hypothetical protein VGJ26_14730, partial [Pirellulales bacterium]
LAIALAFACVGCGKSGPPRKTVYPVSGQVLVDGKPAEQAVVYLHPVKKVENLGRPFGTVKADGSFQIGTYLSNDGAPAGEYAVTVVWQKNMIVEGEERSGPDQLGDRYSNPSQPIAKITVIEGENILKPIQLKKR